jgi:chromosomal replication initiator protein
MNQNDLIILWERCLIEIEKEVSRPNFTTWFKNTYIVREESGTIFVGVPNEFVKDWLQNKYQKMILKALVGFNDSIRGSEFIIAKPQDKPKMLDQKPKEEKDPSIRELPLEQNVSKDDNLNPRYTFDNFIIGTFNELAYTASTAVVTRPGQMYNPLFIYGNSGLGKTHLIQSTGNALKQKYPDKRVFYITLERFATDFQMALQQGKANVFKEKYRRYDTLIIDDIQFIGKMEKTQEELFHTFNTFYESGKQIIFSSDKHPNFIPGLEDRLRTRFSQGMIVDVIEPDYESRLAIIRSKAKNTPYPLTDDVIEYIADVIQGNIRELEGNIKTILLQADVKKKPLTLADIKLILKNSLKPKKTLGIGEIVKIIANFYNVDEATIYEKTRRKEIVYARQVIMYILREDFNISYPLIGQKLGGKDHTTVMHSYEKIKQDLQVNGTLRDEIEQLKYLLK